MNETSETIVYRAAGAADTAALAAFAVESFVATFGHLYPREDLDAFLSANYAPEILAADLAALDVRALVAQRGGAIIGYAMWGPVELAAEAEPKDRELYRLYVHESVKGAGVAHALMHEVVVQARAAGAAGLWLSVWEHNARAQAFYRRFGFTHVGEHDFMVGRVADRDFIWRLDVKADV